MPDLLKDLRLIEEDFYNNLDNRVLEVWEGYKFKWFFPKHRKKQIEKSLYKTYLLHRNAIKEYYFQY